MLMNIIIIEMSAYIPIDYSIGVDHMDDHAGEILLPLIDLMIAAICN